MKMPKDFSSADSVESIAGGLIPNYHPELATARIMYTFVSEASKKNGKDVLGTAKKLSGFNEWALENDFLVTIALDKWNELTENQRMALVDHMLERCTGEEDDESGEMKWKMRDPDVQEFAGILFRHGAWNEDLQGFVSMAKGVNIDQIVEEETAETDEDETEQQTAEE
jgi:Putative phage metallopeptidase